MGISVLRWTAASFAVAIGLAVAGPAWAELPGAPTQGVLDAELPGEAASDSWDDGDGHGPLEPPAAATAPAPVPVPASASARRNARSSDWSALTNWAALPMQWAARLQRRVGAAYAWLGDAENAAEHFERAVARGDRDPALQLALGDALHRSGLSERASDRWSALVEGGSTGSVVEPQVRAAALARLASRALEAGAGARAVERLEEASRLAPNDLALRALLARARYVAAPELEAAPRDRAPLLPRLSDELSPLAGPAADRMLRALADAPAAIRDPVRDLSLRGLASPWMNLAIALGVSLILLLPLLRVLRGGGEVVVVLEFPQELRGNFSVRLSQRDESVRSRRTGGAQSRSVKAGALCHTEVGRETRFHRVRCGRWYVVVDGVLLGENGREVLAERFEVRALRVERNGTTRVELDFQPGECPIDVNVLWDARPAKDAGVAVQGRPDTLRFARGGQARVQLPPGEYTIVVGSGDRVARRTIQVGSYLPQRIEIDLAGSADVVFKGCPPAVAPYLQGDLAEAAKALAREGLEAAAAELLAHRALEMGSPQEAAEHYERAGRWLQAGSLRAGAGEWKRAAELFARAEDHARAAQAYERAQLWTLAGEAHERTRDYANAIRCYRKVGALPELAAALEQCGRFYEAAQAALEAGDRRSAVRLLQHVPSSDPNHANACRSLARAFEEDGHSDLATRKLEELVAASAATAPERFHLAELLEAQGEFETALDVLERLRTTEPTFPNLATRVETLRKRRSEALIATAPTNLVASATPQSQSNHPGQSTRSNHPTHAGGSDRYDILEEIGRGGMGVVYRAHDRRLNREVALKRMPENLSEHPRAVEFFLREAQAVARLNHRNIVTIHDVDHEILADGSDGLYFITMELLKGSPLNRLLRARGRISARDIAKLGVQVATGLCFAHEQGIVHRDIKTANLFLTQDRTVKIMDFGLAKMMAEVRGASTMIGGTPFYMSPEQAVGGAVDHRSDIYALGVTLFELCTGDVPFREGDIAHQHRNIAVPDVRERSPEIGAGLAETIAECMRKDPDNRPQSAQEVVRQLEAFLRSEG